MSESPKLDIFLASRLTAYDYFKDFTTSFKVVYNADEALHCYDSASNAYLYETLWCNQYGNCQKTNSTASFSNLNSLSLSSTIPLETLYGILTLCSSVFDEALNVSSIKCSGHRCQYKLEAPHSFDNWAIAFMAILVWSLVFFLCTFCSLGFMYLRKRHFRPQCSGSNQEPKQAVTELTTNFGVGHTNPMYTQHSMDNLILGFNSLSGRSNSSNLYDVIGRSSLSNSDAYSTLRSNSQIFRKFNFANVKEADISEALSGDSDQFPRSMDPHLQETDNVSNDGLNNNGYSSDSLNTSRLNSILDTSDSNTFYI